MAEPAAKLSLSPSLSLSVRLALCANADTGRRSLPGERSRASARLFKLLRGRKRRRRGRPRLSGLAAKLTARGGGGGGDSARRGAETKVKTSELDWHGRLERGDGDGGGDRRPRALLGSNDLWEAEGSLSLGGERLYMLQGSSL